MNHKHNYVFAFSYLVCTLLLYSSTSLLFLTATNIENSDFLKYEVNDVFVGNLTHIIRINNLENSKVAGGKLLVPLVQNGTARHYAFLHNISSPIGPPKILNDSSGNMYAYWSSIVINGKQTLTVEIGYHVFSFSTRFLVNSSLITEFNESSSVYKKYTQPEELIQSNNIQIISKALEITSNARNIHDKVTKIYNFVIADLRYSVQDEEKGAVWALENGVGDCSEFSYLFVALCRAIGIPARVQAGFAFHSNTETMKDGHMWAQYYLENYGWIPVDATWRLFDAMDYRHFSSIQSIPEVISYSNYVFNYTTGLEPVDEQTVLLRSFSPSVLDESSFAEDAMETVQKMAQAKIALFVGNILGASIVFPSEMEQARKTFLESQIQLQKAIENWDTHQQIAQSHVADALETAEKASSGAWMIIVKIFAIIVGIPMTIILVTLVFLKQRQTRQEKAVSLTA